MACGGFRGARGRSGSRRCGSDRKLRHAAEIGAGAVGDYTGEDWLSECRDRTNGRGVDIVLDGVGGTIGRISRQLLTTTERFIAFGAPSSEFSPEDGPGAISMLDLPMRPGQDVRLVAEAIAENAAGRIVPTVGATAPMEQAAAVRTAIENRRITGKALLRARGSIESLGGMPVRRTACR